jgi:hypothetical protein
MGSMANTLTALEARLDAAIAVAVDAQAAVDMARRRVGLTKAPKAFFTAAEMVAELCAAQDRHDAESRIELREITKAVISDCRMRWDHSYKPTPIEKAMTGWPAAFAALEAGRKTGNVVPLPTGQIAEQIVAAARKRRGEIT